MASKQYSLKTDGKLQLTKNFTVKEFACNDGSDAVVIDIDLVKVLQKIRDYFGVPVTITSGYRTQSYNRRIGGASSSKHITGKAADIKIKGVDPIAIAVYADQIMPNKGGVELGSYSAGDDGYVHIDVRASKWRAIKTTQTEGYTTYGYMMPNVSLNGSGKHVKVLTRKLKKLGYLKNETTNCTADVVKAIKKFQKDNKLTEDGIFGKQCWNKLIEVIKNDKLAVKTKK